MAEQIIVPNLPWIIGGGMLLGALAIAGWIFTTWLRVRNGYPLESSWGQAVYPSNNDETMERVKLLSQENAPAQGRARCGQGPARQCRADRHRFEPPADAGDRIPAHRAELSHGLSRSHDRLHRDRPADDRHLRSGEPRAQAPGEAAGARSADRGRAGCGQQSAPAISSSSGCACWSGSSPTRA